MCDNISNSDFEKRIRMNGVHCVSLPAPSLSHLMYAMEVSPAVLDFKLDEEEDYIFLKHILHSNELHALFKAHDAILLTNAEIGPSLSNSSEIAEQVIIDQSLCQDHHDQSCHDHHEQSCHDHLILILIMITGDGRHPAIRDDVRGGAGTISAVAVATYPTHHENPRQNCTERICAEADGHPRRG